MSLNKSITKLTSTDRETLKSKSAYTLPDNPSDKSFSASQIKSRMYEPVLMLFDWLKDLGDETDDIFAQIGELYTKSEQDTLLADKVDKSTSKSVVYGTDAQGAQKVYDLDVGDALGDVVARDGNGQIKVVQTPTDNLHATSKKYVDDGLATKQGTLTFDDTPTASSTNPVKSGGVYSALSGKEDSSNKVTSISNTSTDTQYPSAKCVYDENKATRDIAEGKTTTFSVDPTTEGNEALQADTAEITLTSFEDVDGNTITVSDLKRGDEIFTLNGVNNKYKDRWLIDPSTGTWGLLDADSPDLSGYVTLDTAQTVTGIKQFSNGIKINDEISLSASGNHNILDVYRGGTKEYSFSATSFMPAVDNTFNIGTSSYAWKDLYLSGSVDLGNTVKINSNSYNGLQVQIGGNNIFTIYTGYQLATNFYPATNNAYNLGSSGNQWKDAYLAGNVYLGTSSQIQSTGSIGIFAYVGTNTTGFTLGNGAVQVSRNFMPSTDNQRDLGTATANWKDLYLAGTQYMSSTGKIDFSDNYSIRRNSTDIVIACDNNSAFAFRSGTNYTYGHLLPTTNNARDLGSSSLQFKDAYLAGKIYGVGNNGFDFGTENYTMVRSHFRPTVTGTYDLGSTSFKWRDIKASRDIWVQNNLTDGTNSIKVAKIANKDNFVKISQADYDALVSGDEVDEDTFYFIEEE